MRARTEIHLRREHGGPALPAARVRHLNGAGDVDAVGLEVQQAARSGRREPEPRVVHSVAAHAHGVLKPLARPGPADVEAAADIARALDVDVCSAEGTTFVPRRRIVIRDSLTPIVEL